MLLVFGATFAFGLYECRRYHPFSRVFLALAFGWSAFAASEAAAFHVGIQSDQWALLTLAPWPVIGAAVALTVVFKPYWQAKFRKPDAQ